MSQKEVPSMEEEHAHRERRLASFLADCQQQRLEAGTEQLEAMSAAKSPQNLMEKTTMQPSPSLQHFGYVALSGKPEDVKQLRIDIVLEPTVDVVKNKGDTFLIDLDLKVQKPN